MYFEYNLTLKAPDHMEPEVKVAYEKTMRDVSSRMDKLEAALNMSSLKASPAAFAETAKRIFDGFPETFEAMTAEELAHAVEALYDGRYVEERMEFPRTETVIDAAFVQNHEWEYIRMDSIGGSDGPVVTGASIYRVQSELAHDKWGTPMKEEDGKEAVFKRGHVMEPDVINVFLERTGAVRIPETRMFRSKKYPHCTANIDALVRFPDGSIYVYEAKTTVEENFIVWTGSKIPAQYIDQMRQYPAVLDDDRIKGTYIGCLLVKDVKIGETLAAVSSDARTYQRGYLDRDPAAEEALLQAEEDFWNTYIVPHVLPPKASAAKEIAVLDAITGPVDPAIPPVDLDYDFFEEALDQWNSYNQQYADAKKVVEDLKGKRDEYSMLFIEALGKAAEGIIDLDDGSYILVSYKGAKKVKIDADLLCDEYPEVYAVVSENVETKRTFKISKPKRRKPDKAKKEA